MGNVLSKREVQGLLTENDGAPGDIGIITYQDTDYLAGKVNGSWKYVALEKIFESIDKEAFKNVKDFGAIGNGATNEVFAINRASSKLTNGGAVYFPPGDFYIAASETDINTKSRYTGSGGNASVRGDGDSKIFRQKASTNLDMVSFDNFMIDGDSPNGPTNPGNVEGGHGIDLYRSGQTSTNNIISNMWIKDIGGDGVYLRESDKNIIHGMNIDVNWQTIGANLRGRNGIAMTDGDTLIIANCYIRGAANAGIDLEPNPTEDISRVVINNCIIEDCLYGIELAGSSGATPPISHVAISNCVIRVGDKSAGGFNANTEGILIQACETATLSNIWVVGQSDPTKSGNGVLIDNVSNVKLNNVNVTKCLRGIKIFSDNGTNDKISITGGEISECQEHGLSLIGTNANRIFHLTLNGVQAFNNDNLDTGFNGINIAYADNVNVNNCMAFDDQTGSETQNIGINIGNSGNVVVVGNLCYGNTSNQILLTSNTVNEFGHNIGGPTVA